MRGEPAADEQRVAKESNMDYENLKIQIKEIAEIATSVEVPTHLQEKCFEILLNHLILSKPDQVNSPANLVTQHRDETIARTGEAYPFSGHMRAFMRRTQITSEDIFNILIIDDGEVHFTSEPETKQKTQGVIQWALLWALRNAFVSEKGELRVDPEELRSICQEKGYYDQNFSTTLKNRRNSPLFGGKLEPQGDARKLSSKGEDKLAELIRDLGG